MSPEDLAKTGRLSARTFTHNFTSFQYLHNKWQCRQSQFLFMLTVKCQHADMMNKANITSPKARHVNLVLRAW